MVMFLFTANWLLPTSFMEAADQTFRACAVAKNTLDHDAIFYLKQSRFFS